MELFENENILVFSSRNGLILTNMRIIKQSKSWGEKQVTDIRLEDIASIQAIRQSPMILLHLATLFVILSLYNVYRAEESLSLLALALSSLFFIIWYFTKRRMIRIYPKEGKAISLPVYEMEEEAIQGFLEKTLEAKKEHAKPNLD